MRKHPLRAIRQGVALLLAQVGALLGCSAPFTAASDCAGHGNDCAISVTPVSETGGVASRNGGDAGDGGDGAQPAAVGATGQGGMLGDAGAVTSSDAGSPAALGGAASVDALPVSCKQALERDLRDAKILIDPDGSGPVQPFEAHCDMTTDGGGWTQIGVGEYWQKNDLQLASDSVLPQAVLQALFQVSDHLFRAGDGDHRLYLEDEGAVVEKLDDPAGTASMQPWLWRSKAASLKCAVSYDAVASHKMIAVDSKAVSCEPLAFGKHTCGSDAGWILLRRNDTMNYGGHPCAFAPGTGGTPQAPTAGGLRPLFLR